MDLSLLLIRMVIFAVLLASGYAAARKGLLSPEFAKSASWLVMNIFLVASIINSVIGSSSEMPAGEVLFALAVLTGLFILLYALATVYSVFFCRDKANAPFMVPLLGTMNNLFIGLPVLQAVSGAEAVFYDGLSNVPFNLVLYTYGVWMMTRNRGEGKVNWKRMLSAPLIASLAALLLFALKLPMPRLVTEFFSTVSAATTPVSMIVIGATLGGTDLREALQEKRIYLLCAIKLVVFPLIVFFLCRHWIADEALLMTLVVLAGCPSGIVCTPLALQYGYDAVLSSKCLLAMTMLSMITLPAILLLLF